MPRKTPVREVKAEEAAVVDSPRRRSSRIAAVSNNTSTPTAAAKVATRRSSASETSAQPARVTRRLSLSQDTKEPESPLIKNAGKSPTTLLKEHNLKSTPAKLRGRRGSKTTEDENSQPAAVDPPKPADPPRRTTRRSSISTLEKIQETESPKPVKRLTRRRSSASDTPQLDKITENETEKEKPKNMETISENAEEVEEKPKDDAKETEDKVFASEDKINGDAKIDEAKKELKDEKVNRLSLKKTEENAQEDDAGKLLHSNEEITDKTSFDETNYVLVENDVEVLAISSKQPDADIERQKSNVDEEIKESTEDKEPTRKNEETPNEDEDSVEVNYNKLKEIISNPPEGTNRTAEDEEVENLDLVITADKTLDTSGNFDKENSKDKSNIPKTPDTLKLIVKSTTEDPNIQKSTATTVLRAQVEETQIPSSPAGKRKSLTKSPTRGDRRKSASPAFSVTAENISDDEAVVESPSKRRKSEGNDDKDSETKMEEAPQASPKPSVDSEAMEVDVVNDDEVIEDSEPEEEVQLNISQKARTPKKRNDEETKIMDEEKSNAEETEINEGTSTPSPSKSNTDGSFKIEATKAKIKILDVTPIANVPVDINEKMPKGNEEEMDNGDNITAETSELLNTSFTKKNETADNEDDVMDGANVVPQAEEKKSNESHKSTEEEKAEIFENASEKLQTNLVDKDQSKNIEDVKNGIEEHERVDEEEERKGEQDVLQAEKSSRRSLNASHLSSSPRKSRQSLKSLNATRNDEVPNIDSEEVPNSKKTTQNQEDNELNKTSSNTQEEISKEDQEDAEMYVIEDEGEETTQVEKCTSRKSLNSSQASNTSKKSRRSVKSDNQGDEDDTSNETVDSKKTPKKSRKSLNTEENATEDTVENKTDDLENEEVELPQETNKNTRKSLNTSQLSNSSKKSRRSMKSDSQDENEDSSLKQTSKKSKKSLNTLESAKTDEETEELEKNALDNEETVAPRENDSQESMNTSKLSNTSKKSRRSIKSDSQVDVAPIEEANPEDLQMMPKKSRKSLNTSQRKSLKPEIEDLAENPEDTAQKKSRKSVDKRRSLKESEDFDDDLDSEIDETEMAEIEEFLGEVITEDQMKEKKERRSVNSKRRSQVEEEFERYERDDKKEKEIQAKASPKKKKITIIETEDDDELDAQVSAYLKKKADELDSSDDSEDEDYKPTNELIDDEAEEVEEEESDVSTDSNEIPCEGESLNSSDTETDGEEEEEEDDSFICDDEDIELLSGNEDFLEDKSPMKKKGLKTTKSKSKKGSEQKFSRIVVNDEGSNSDNAVEEDSTQSRKEAEPAKQEETKKTTKLEEGVQEISDEEEAEVTEKVVSPVKPTTKMETSIIKVDDSDTEDAFSTIKEDPNDSKAEASTILDTTTQGRRKSVRKSSMSVQENISVQDFDEGELSQRLNTVVEWFYTNIKSNADMSGNISLNLSLDYTDKKNDDEVKSPEKRRKSIGAIEVTEKVSESNKRKSTEVIEIPNVPGSSKKRKSTETLEISSPSPKKKAKDTSVAVSEEETVTSPQKKSNDKTKSPAEKESDNSIDSPKKKANDTSSVLEETMTSPQKKNKDKTKSPAEKKSDNSVDSPKKKAKVTSPVSEETMTSPQKKSKDKTKSPVEKKSDKSVNSTEETTDVPTRSPAKKVKDKKKQAKKEIPESVVTAKMEVESDDEAKNCKERVQTKKEKKTKEAKKPQHGFEETAYDGETGQLRSIVEFKQLKLDGLGDWKKTDSVVKPSISEEPEKTKKKKSHRKPRQVKPSVSMDGDNGWVTEVVTEAAASLSLPKLKRKKGADAGSSNVPSFHPKDFKNQVIHAMGRVPRMDSKILLRKRKV